MVEAWAEKCLPLLLKATQSFPRSEGPEKAQAIHSLLIVSHWSVELAEAMMAPSSWGGKTTLEKCNFAFPCIHFFVALDQFSFVIACGAGFVVNACMFFKNRSYKKDINLWI